MFEMLCSRHARLAAVIGVLLLGLWVAAPAAQQPGAAAAQAAPAAQERLATRAAKPIWCSRISEPVDFHGINGRTLLMAGLVVCVFGLAFGMVIFTRLKNLPVHKSMRDISELIYETCKTYLITQGKFILLLELFIGVIMVFYFGVLQHMDALKVAVILLFSLVGIAGSYGVAWFGIRVNTFANSRAAFAGLQRQAVSDLRDPAQRRHEHRHAAHQRRAAADAVHPALHSRRLRRRLLHRLRHRRVARRRGAAHRRRHLHQDRRHRLGPDEDRLQHQGRRRAQPRASSPTARATTPATRSVRARTASRPTASPASRSSPSSSSRCPIRRSRSSCSCGSS